MNSLKVDPYLLYHSGRLSAPYESLPVQETILALFLVRPMLFQHNPQLRLYLVPPR